MADENDHVVTDIERPADAGLFAPWLARWQLAPDGNAIHTHGSDLLPVRCGYAPAMLKVSREVDEEAGRVLMCWWQGEGAARVLAYEGDALLLERAMGTHSLTDMARHGRDDEATEILCAAVARLHAPRTAAAPDLIPLASWFRELWPAAEAYGGLLARCADVARGLLETPRDVVPLHGDIHHDNVLDFGERGWLAIDPKRLIGERGFDYANIFTNPLGDGALMRDRFPDRVEIVAAAARLDRRRLLEWIVAWSGLSAAWWLGDDAQAPADDDLAIAALADEWLRADAG